MRSVTFRELDGEEQVEPSPDELYFSLPRWYLEVRDTPIKKFKVKDLCVAARQQIHPDYVVPEVLRRLAKEPLAGELHDGELLCALRGIRAGYWRAHPEQATSVRNLVAQHKSAIEEELHVFLHELEWELRETTW